MPLAIGQVIQNRYRIDALLGQGGFGAVYRAFDLNLSTAVAIKENLDSSPEAQRQFAREASLLVNLRHPSLPRVTDYFFIPGQGQYLVMDFIAGQDLQEMLDQLGPLDEARALAWMGQVLDALAYLHTQSPPIIHRDLKPANVRVMPDGRAVLVDFGIAKLYDPRLLTTTGARAVTPGYSPWEQYGQAGTDTRSDVYAAGATLYTLLTGQTPPESMYLMAGIAQLRPPSLVNPRISPHVEAVILKAMTTQPTGRYADAGQMRAALRMAKTPQALSSVPQPAPSLAKVSRSAPLQGLPVWLLWLAGVVIVGLVVALLLVLSQQPSPSSTVRVITATPIVSAITATPTKTRTPIPTLTSTPTSRPTDTPMPTPTATPGIGSTRVSEKDGMVQVYVPAGEFLMGAADSDPDGSDDEKPQHTVYLNAFWIDKTEVTNAMFTRFMATTGYKTDAEKGGKGWVYTGVKWEEVSGADWQHPGGPTTNISGLDDHPVVQVSWNDALAYCGWVGRQLPTEAEWEKAARGTEGRIYPWGNQAATCEYAVMDDSVMRDSSRNGCGTGNAAWSVGSRPKGISPYGALDMGGNVWEWVADWYDDKYYASSPSRNPQGPPSGSKRVLRGGGWADTAISIRVAYRFGLTPEHPSHDNGFRCVVYGP